MSSYNDLPPEIQEKIKQMQNLQNQLQALRQQLDVSQSKVNELKGTLKEIESFEDSEELFKTVGQVMFKTTVGKIKAEFGEDLELLELQIKTLKNKDEKWKAQLNEMNKSITSQLNLQ
jgi:prefoldin beta subunit